MLGRVEVKNSGSLAQALRAGSPQGWPQSGHLSRAPVGANGRRRWNSRPREPRLPKAGGGARPAGALPVLGS